MCESQLQSRSAHRALIIFLRVQTARATTRRASEWTFRNRLLRHRLLLLICHGMHSQEVFWLMSETNVTLPSAKGRDGMERMQLDDGTGVGCDTGPQVGLKRNNVRLHETKKRQTMTYAFLGDGTRDSRTLHLSLGVDNDTSVVLFDNEHQSAG